jgi:hypothetical protein
MPVLLDDLLIYQNKANELKLTNINSTDQDTSFSAQAQPAYFLGFKMGQFNDVISAYRVAQCGSTWLLYYTTFSGSVGCIDVLRRKLIFNADRFRGTENNAGLIAFFELFDVNLDDTPDIIGTSVDNHVYALDGSDLSLIWHTDTGDENQMPASFFDITGDAIPEIFCVNDAMNLFIISGSDGQVILNKSLSHIRYQTGICLTDYNGDGQLNLICNLNANTIKIYHLAPMKIERNSILWQTFL